MAALEWPAAVPQVAYVPPQDICAGTNIRIYIHTHTHTHTYIHIYIYIYIYIYCLLYWCKRTNTDAGGAAAKTASRRAASKGLEARVSLFAGFTGAKLPILTQKALLPRPLRDRLLGLEAQVSRCSVYLIYWHKSTNTDAEARVSSDVQADGIYARGHATSAAAAGAWPCHGTLWAPP